VWGLAAHPRRPDQILAATDQGVYRWSESEARWHHVPSPMDGLHVWQIQHAPDDPDLILAGVSPGGLFRSEDGGVTWERLDLAIPARCMFNVISRVTQIVFDPVDSDLVWAGVEIDAIWRSTDRGRRWTRISNGLVSDDVHGLAVTARGGRRRLLAATNRGLHVSDDDGESFRLVPIDAPYPYFRAVAAGWGSDGRALLTNGDGPPGSSGRLYRSEDWGETWRSVPLPNQPNSTLWTIATDPFDADLVFVCSNLGEVYRSTDGGRSVRKLAREMGEIRSCLWRPV
jgi:photosystem II stability/assembly factor-like uncharacterized protein